MKLMKVFSKFFALIFITKIAFAGPWMTGPLLAPSGKTIPARHANIEIYGFYSTYPMGYKNLEGVPIISLGLTDYLDLQTSAPFDYSWNHGQHGGGIGDFMVGLGLQVLKEKDNSIIPDLRVTVSEVFPSGKFENLNPNKLATDQTGIGASQTLVGFNFQKLMHIYSEHYLRTRLSLLYSYINKVKVHGFNTFGGGFNTEGVVNPGNSFAADLAFEYSLTQNWVPVFEVLFVHSSASGFNGNPGFTAGGILAGVGGGRSEQVSFAPALEYNFSPNIGIIGGVWFFVKTPQSAKFTSGVIAVNFYF